MGAATRQCFPGRGLRAGALAAALRATVRPTLTAWSFAPSTIWPARVLDLLAGQLPSPPGTAVHTVHLGPCDGEWVQPDGVQPGRAILYLHGGALVTCSLATHRILVSNAARACQAPALNVDFRMMPRVTIEHMVSDCLAGYRWLLEQGYRGDRIAVVGDSAGGYLAVLTALAIRADGLPAPAALAMMSPLLDLDVDRKGRSRYRDGCDVFTLRACSGLARFTAAVDRFHETPGTRVQPVDADLRGLPPTLIQIGSGEILRPDAEAMVDRLAACGVPTRLQVWDRQVHVFQAAAPLLPEARSALRELGEFVRHRLAAPHPC